MKKNRKQIIAAGHICLDITPAFPNYRVERIEDALIPGRLLQVGNAEVSIGGCVGNTGLAFKVLGADVILIGKIGKDIFGEMVLSKLKKHNADEHMLVCEDSTTAYSLVVAPQGIDRIFLHHSGGNDTYCVDDLDMSLIKDSWLFHFGYPPIMKSMYQNGGGELLRLFREVKKMGVMTSLDMTSIDENSEAGTTDWEQILRDILPFVDFFVPSVEELAFMIDKELFYEWHRRAQGKDITTVLDIEKDIKPLAEKLLSYGTKVILIKCGTLGMYLATTSEKGLVELSEYLSGGSKEWSNLRFFEKSYKPERVLSATGAGDTSIAAFLFAVTEGYSYQESLRLATATGALCVGTYDSLSGIKRFDELKKKIDMGWEKTW